MSAAERQELSRKLLIALMDLDVELSNILRTARFYQDKDKWNHESVEGIFQINSMDEASDLWDREMTRERQEDARMCWHDTTSALTERQGWGDVPVIYLQIVNNSEEIATPVIPIFLESIDAAKRKPSESKAHASPKSA